ncbi:hypothetical protein BA011_28825 (plasmid) [Rhizobium leguminosarum]|uniref:Uncharacterized protein n=1 Tax=Rhizobium leguminosarum TaxID=384 RepID=A0A1B1CJV6_RHILE|nr:hypothetical protein BA011_28825 [Rhizobium leguminosarum]
MTEFQDIRITELDADASGPAESGPLMNMVLNLSAEAPAYWRDAFTDAWKQPATAMRRQAVVDGSRLTSTCMAFELQGQIDQLNEVISATNEACRLGTEQAALRQDGELRDLKASLRYD